MASTTANLGMTLPAVSDPADIGVLNENFKKIDEKCNPALFAPSGYGLNNNFKTVNNTAALDRYFTCGWVRFINTTTDDLLMGCRQAIIRIDSYSNSVGKEILSQTAYLFYGNIKNTIQRICYDGVWEQWEWVNPPMALGVEYRTTERWNVKPVYTKLLNCGKAVNGGDVLLGLDRTCVIIRQAGTAPDAGLVLPYGRTSTSQLSADLAVNSGVWHAYFAVSEGYDGKFDVYLQLWYTKE